VRASRRIECRPRMGMPPRTGPRSSVLLRRLHQGRHPRSSHQRESRDRSPNRLERWAKMSSSRPQPCRGHSSTAARTELVVCSGRNKPAGTAADVTCRASSASIIRRRVRPTGRPAPPVPGRRPSGAVRWTRHPDFCQPAMVTEGAAPPTSEPRASRQRYLAAQLAATCSASGRRRARRKSARCRRRGRLGGQRGNGRMGRDHAGSGRERAVSGVERQPPARRRKQDLRPLGKKIASFSRAMKPAPSPCSRAGILLRGRLHLVDA